MELSIPTAADAFAVLNSVMRPAVQAGVGNPLPVGGGAIVLETVGRVSGTIRQVPVLAVRRGNKLTVSTVRDDSQWLANIEAERRVAVWIYGRRVEGVAEVDRGCLNVVSIELAEEPQPFGDTGTQS